MKQRMKSLKRWVEFVEAMAERELKSRYKSSWLGRVWLVLNPLIQVLTMWVIFRYLNWNNEKNYLLYLASGLAFWNYLGSSIMRAVPSIVSERNLIKKANFPRETIIVSILLVNLIQIGISVIILILLMLILKVEISWSILWLPVIISMLLMLTSGVCLMLAAINVMVRDVNYSLNFLTSVWFYVTPVVYSISVLPQKVSSWLYVNPVTGLLELWRWSLLGNKIENWNMVFLDVLMVFVIFFSGGMVFRKLSLEFDDWI